MANISLTLYTIGFFGSILKSPTQMGSLSVNNSDTNIVYQAWAPLHIYAHKKPQTAMHPAHSLPAVSLTQESIYASLDQNAPAPHTVPPHL